MIYHNEMNDDIKEEEELKEINEVEYEEIENKKNDETETADETEEIEKKEDLEDYVIEQVNKREIEFKKRLKKLSEEKEKFRMRSTFGGNFSYLIFLLLLALSMYMMFFRSSNGIKEYKTVSYTEFINKIKTNDIKEIEEVEDKINGSIKGTKTVYQTKKITDRLGEDTNLMNLIAEKSNIEIKSANSGYKKVFLQIGINILSIVLVITFMNYMFRRMMGGGGSDSSSPFNIGKSRARKSKQSRPNITFEDVAGLDEVKEEVQEIVEFLKNPKKFKKAGARVPKGVLLLGEPGTGKTLLAKAIAGESGANFFSISGSEFVEMYVGVGAARVRDLFKEAKKSTPSIIFIDEIDAIGRNRSNGRNGGNDEREQTLNQLLVEMDGFETDAKVIVIAATNREDILDKALLRSGRFDRRIAVTAPDLQARVAILKLHTKNKKLASDVKLEDIAKITAGFVGADLENLVNEAAIHAVRNDRKEIAMEDLDEAVDKIGMGLGQKGKMITPEDKKMLAYHEGGHALVASLLENTDKVHKVTIIPRGDAGGYTMTLPKEKLNKRSKEILADIMVAFGGRVGEYLGLDDIGTGAYSDIQKATYYAKVYIQSYGLDTEMGPINYEQSRQEEYAFIDSNSERTKELIDKKVKELLDDLYKKTLDLLTENKETLDQVAELLLARETVTGAEIRAIVKGKTAKEVLEMKQDEIELYY